MEKQFTFYKEPDGRWYIDLPEWQGSKEDLEMVQGADRMLDLLSKGQDRIILMVSEQFILDFQSCLVKTSEPETGGATYSGHIVMDNVFIGIKIWLCYVTKFVYGYFPKTIYLKITYDTV